MKLLVATRTDDSVRELTALTHPIIRRFVEKWGADFLELSEGPMDIRPTHPDEYVEDARRHYRIMRSSELFNDYDRILHIDSDVLIMPSCPNPFEVVPENCIGTILEDLGSRLAARRRSIFEVQQRWGDVSWKTGYINTGVFVVSREHRPIFQPVNDEYWTSFGVDDVHLGWQIHKHGFEIHELPYQFNHLGMFSEVWNGSPDKFDSHIIHYAGKARRSLELIQGDIEKVYG